MQKIKLELDLDDVNIILQILGQAPTSSNVWPLMQRIQQQAREALQQQNTNNQPETTP